MIWRRDDDSSGKRGYHHGNLREALIEAALSLIGQKGPAGFTVAEAARAAGVSPAAPYRHFRDRDAMIADIAARGFSAFTEALAAAWNNGMPQARAAFERVGRAYLDFARREPALFSAMFESGLAIGQYPDVQLAAERAFAVLREACEGLVATLPKEGRPPVMMVALHYWSLAHGIAALFGRGDRARRAIPMQPEELLEAASMIYLKGLAAPR
jgi:AcrR family transcriptional regulator